MFFDQKFKILVELLLEATSLSVNIEGDVLNAMFYGSNKLGLSCATLSSSLTSYERRFQLDCQIIHLNQVILVESSHIGHYNIAILGIIIKTKKKS